MSDPIRYTGERLVPGVKALNPMRVENLARFHFFMQQFSALAHAPDPRILDLGCGAGEGTAAVGQQGWQVWGVDLSPEAARFARAAYPAPNIAFASMDAGRLGFASRAFDAVVSIEVIEHLADPRSYLREAARVLKPGGLFVLSTPNQLRSSPTPGSMWPEHVHEYHPTELQALLEPFFSSVALWSEYVPVYEGNPARRAMRALAPFVKPLLPHWLRVRALPSLQAAIKSDLALEDVRFTRENIAEHPTLVALCTC